MQDNAAGIRDAVRDPEELARDPTERYLLADSSKFGTMATYRVAPLAAARIVTDAKLPSEWRARLADMGVEATIVEAGTPT